jgi:hypothetical protein
MIHEKKIQHTGEFSSVATHVSTQGWEKLGNSLRIKLIVSRLELENRNIYCDQSTFIFFQTIGLAYRLTYLQDLILLVWLFPFPIQR